MSDITVTFWLCRACKTLWKKEQLYVDPQVMGFRKWTCGNLFCGAVCDPAPTATKEEWSKDERKRGPEIKK